VTRYLLGRVGGATLVMALVTCAVFLLFEVLPGDAAITVLSRGGASGTLPRSSWPPCATSWDSTVRHRSGS
jgi:peptide/nickel transport system permease protein